MVLDVKSWWFVLNFKLVSCFILSLMGLLLYLKLFGFSALLKALLIWFSQMALG